MNLAGPGSLGNPDEVRTRLAMLRSEPHSAPLASWVDETARGLEVDGLPMVMPYIDPRDAGKEARVLLLLEAPGPMTNTNNTRPGSGFISSDNADPTARNLWNARRDAGLIEGVLIWNAVPWYLGPTSRKPTAVEREDGAKVLRALIAQLSHLHTVVPLGRHAQQTWRQHGRPSLGRDVRTVESWHSGAQAMNQAGKRGELVAALSRAASDWRLAPTHRGTHFVDHNRQREIVSNWYVDAHGDRIDVAKTGRAATTTDRE